MVHLYSDLEEFDILYEAQLGPWLKEIASKEDNTLSDLSYVFCDDAQITSINRQFLQHDYPTDIITFPYEYHPVEAEIYISIPTVRANAMRFGVSFESEYLRVIAHGLLHMLGYNDKTEKERDEMTRQENKTILLFESLYPKTLPEHKQ